MTTLTERSSLHGCNWTARFSAAVTLLVGGTDLMAGSIRHVCQERVCPLPKAIDSRFVKRTNVSAPANAVNISTRPDLGDGEPTDQSQSPGISSLRQ